MTYLLQTLLCCGVGFGLACLTVWWILRALEGRAEDASTRDLHHTHKRHVPRLGGIALAVAFIVVELYIALFHAEDYPRVAQLGAFIGGALAMFLLGLWDDLKPLGAKKKLAGQILIAAGVYYLGIGIDHLKIPLLGVEMDLGYWGAPVTVLWLVGLTNLVNLIDGADGLAGGICLMLMALLSYVGYHDPPIGLLAAGMAGALLGFLRFNFPPARIYMGDGGAYLLGFLIGLITIVSSHKGTIAAALISPLFVLALPILDTALAILRRGTQGLPVFRPDRKHIHHRLMAMGVPSRKVVLGAYLFTLVFLIMGFLAFFSRGQLVPILFGVALLIILACAGKLSFSREWFAVGRVLGNSLDVRQEVQYALCLNRWLELEAARAVSVETLHSDFVFLLKKLGFCYARLTLPDGDRVWQWPECPLPPLRARHELQGGRVGILELGAWLCPVPEDAPVSDPAAGLAIPDEAPRIESEKLFEILNELAAEAWLKAARMWEKTHRQPVLFQPSASSPGRILASPVPAAGD